MSRLNALTAARAALLATAGETITYRRGNATVPLTAVPAMSKYEQLDDAGQVVERTTAQDWLIDPATLELDDEPTQPLAGDQIDRTIGGEIVTYAVTAPAPRVPPWSWSDATHTWLRVHTTEIAAETT